MKKLQILSLFVAISFFSCSDKKPSGGISDFKIDFPSSGNLEFKYFNEYEILEEGNCMIDDSKLWYFKENDQDLSVGYCYDLNSGEKLSMITSKGHADYELIELDPDPNNIKMTDDSIQLRSDNSIKTFSKKDILENKPMNERRFSVETVPDSINVGRMTKLPNGSVVATMRVTRGRSPQQKLCNINDASVVVFNNNEVKAYETINYGSFDVEIPDSELKPSDVIKNAYTYGYNEIKNDIAVFSVARQFILYTFDLKSGNVVKEKRYTEMKGDGRPMSLFTTNDNDMDITYMKSNDKYIYCIVGGYYSEEDKKAELRTRKIFVFDWDLNPIKCFDLPNDIKDGCVISNDCKSAYLCDYNDDGLTLFKADLNI